MATTIVNFTDIDAAAGAPMYSLPANGDTLLVGANGYIAATGTKIAVSGTGQLQMVDVQGTIFTANSNAVQLLGASNGAGNNVVNVGRDGEIIARGADAIRLSGDNETINIEGRVYGSSNAISASDATNNGSDNYQISIGASASVTARDGAAISISGDNTEINNAGIIASSDFTAIFINDDTGGNVITNSGTIQGDDSGIDVYDSDNIVTNSGTITARTVDGIRAQDGIGHTISNSGSIAAGQNGIHVGGTSEVSNSGDIVAQTYGIYALGGSSSIINSGEINADDTGIFASGTSDFTVLNTGVVSSKISSGIQISANASTIQNDGSVIGGSTSSAYGALMAIGNNNAIVNNGSASAYGTGIYASGTSNHITNTGEVQSTNEYGVRAAGDGADLVNSGTITALDDDAVWMNGSSANVTNSGTITGDDTAIYFNGGSSRLVNTGTLVGTGFEGVYFGSSSPANSDVLINHGTITSMANEGVYFASSEADRLVNHGTIQGGGNYEGVQMASSSGGGARLDNFGTINPGLDGSVAVAMGSGDDTVRNLGTLGGDVELGSGADFFNGFGDSLVTGTVFGEAGNDVLVGSHNADVLDGGSENDQLFGGLGDDELYGGTGSDILRGGAGGDIVNGGDGFDQANYENSTGGVAIDLRNGSAFGGHAAGDVLSNIESLVGSAFDDTLNGNSGVNILRGEGGNDFLRGFAGNDDLRGGDGNDEIIGDLGFDTITGGAGNDTLTGGINGDTFVYANGFGQDTITDFEELNDFEKIDLSAVTAITDFADLAANHLTQSGANAVITDGANTITLNNVNIADLDANDFIF
ncbi:beta strand repeat-containing protein [Jiella marina]|uniref:beta strand repeat-containing protein n=1 Tax=Jiella sp. LLJ827 TaxID=2917712 RepID=UPI0026F37020|nr:calcium-binding protein [Jiella sp. LLJ827]